MASELYYAENRYSDEANAAAVGITDIDKRNAFVHIHVSAQLARKYGDLIALVGGAGREIKNHWKYRYGGPESELDPHQRRDSFRDLWNNGIGREIGKLAVDNDWTNDQVADYVHRAVTQGVAIIDRLADSRIPVNLSQLSSWDYLLRSQGASVGAIRNLAPAGAKFLTETVGWELPASPAASEASEVTLDHLPAAQAICCWQ